MGLLKAGIGALGGVLADSWRDYFYCESLDADTLVVKGEKKAGSIRATALMGILVTFGQAKVTASIAK